MTAVESRYFLRTNGHPPVDWLLGELNDLDQWSVILVTGEQFGRVIMVALGGRDV